MRKAFHREIPLAKRDDWDAYVANRRGKHEALTGEIIMLETRMNQIVYEAFRLTSDEIGLIERATKYPYGEP